MLEFFTNYGADLTAILVAVGGIIVTAYNTANIFVNNRKVRKDLTAAQEAVKITQDGIVEAFKIAKIPNELKVSLSKQVDTKLNEWQDKVIKLLEKYQSQLLETNLMMLKILSYTAASNKLTDEDKARLEDFTKRITGEDQTIEV